MCGKEREGERRKEREIRALERVDLGLQGEQKFGNKHTKIAQNICSNKMNTISVNILHLQCIYRDM